MPTRRSKAAESVASVAIKKPTASKKRPRTLEPSDNNNPESENRSSISDVDRTPKRAKVSVDASENAESQQDDLSQEMLCHNSNKTNDWDEQTLKTMNDRLRDELAQVRTELEHSQRLLQLNMGRAPVLEDRACQSETVTLIEQYDNIRRATQAQLSKMKPSHPKYWWWEYAHHLNTEMCRLVRESWTYRGFSV